MADTAAGFVGAAVEIVRWVGAPIIRQVSYLRCFTTNIASLQLKGQDLENAAAELQRQVDRERENVQVIVHEVKTWLKTSNDIKGLKNTILNEATNLENGCLKLRARYSLSKRAKKTTDRIIKLLGEKNFDAIAQTRPPAARMAVPLGMYTYEFESRKQIEEDIMTSLRGGNVKMIGICGMGGLGKTTMAKIIKKRALEEHVFEEVVMTVVSQSVDKLKIQVEIGGSLNLKLEGETSEVRVQKLRERLTTEGTKSILLVLDDVWERLELEDLGIPCGSKGCTILLTSRNRHVLNEMDVQKENIFGMEILSEKDSWFLFRERAGTCVDDARLNSLVKQVMKECSGLPIALVTVGVTLKDENDVAIWKDALCQLKQSNPDIPEFVSKVYNPLKLSYDALGSQHAKSVFLLCSLFGEDADICIDYLTYLCMALRIFEGGVEEARNRMCALIKMLKSRSLLLDSDEENCVRMHDVVRDVCIFIAKEEGYIGGNDYTWISSFQTRIEEGTKLPTNLRLLFLSGNSKMEEEIKKFDNTFIEGIRDLRVMFIEQNYSFTSLPRTTWSLKNLNTLILSSCGELETLSGVGELVNLEILICRDCPWIEELPPEIKGLHHLKVLDLTSCRGLQRIGRGIISSLVGLEELKMLDSFDKWEASNRKERENAELRELEALTNLTCLEIDIQDTALAAENMRLSSKLERFDIRIGLAEYEFSSYSNNKKMILKWEGETCVGEWIEMQLIRDAECLRLIGNVANNVDYLAKCPNIRWLYLEKCETMKNIGRTSMDDATVFPHMEHLELHSLPQLEEILDGPISSNSFHNLKKLRLEDLPALKQLWKNSGSPVFHNLSSIHISSCPRLRNLGQFSIAGKDCLSQLQTLKIYNCEMTEQVFLWNEEGERRTAKIMFPKLKEVRLYNLPNLVTLCQGIGSIEFPLLTEMSIEECPKMKSMVSSKENECGGSSNNNHSSHLFCQPQKVSLGSLKNMTKDNVSFGSLKKLIISGNEDIMSLFSSSTAANLVNLRELRIQKCDEMVQVIEDGEEKKAVSGGDQNTLLFPNLQELKLEDLCKLVSFCGWKCNVELPSLKKLHINGCPDMKSFTLGFLSAPNLEDFTTNLPNYLEDGVLNVSFDSLKILTIKGNENPLYSYKIHASLFNGLQELTIYWYKGSMSLFSPSIAGNLVSLRKLEIYVCYEMVTVIEDKKEEENVVSSGGAQTTTIILFPKLQELTLISLEKLESFCEWKCDVELPSLRKVEIKQRSNIKIFNLGSNVSFCFHGLEELTISSYEGRMSLFSSSMATNILVSLRKLEISYCNEMVAVIENEKEEENVVSSGGAQTTTIILFPKLQELKLEWLWKLESFCEWKCDVRLPSLKKVEISWCQNMKIFTSGPLATPNLESVKINHKDLEIADKDLNGALIKKHYLAREKEKQKEETAYDDEEEVEEEGNGGEIEEEQNWKTTTPAEEEEEEEEQEEEEGRKGEIEEEQNS